MNQTDAPTSAPRPRVVILGAGFGGLYTALNLEKKDRGARTLDVTLVNRDNYFLMTPLLFEAGSGVLEPRHAVSPIRPMLRTTRFIEADVEGIDRTRKIVCVRNAPTLEAIELPYDHLVIALGGVTNTKLIPGSEIAFTFKTLADAILLRNHLIDLFERADLETDVEKQRALLSIVVVGGGLVGVELVGELLQFVHHLGRVYPRVPKDLGKIHLIDAGHQILGELEEKLASYAHRKLAEQGVDIRTGVRVKAIERGRVILPDADPLATSTVILASGVVPNPLLQNFDLPKDRRGKIETNAAMLVNTTTDVWAIGDCASIPDPQGNPFPPLAQHALREARVLARNLLATVNGQPLKSFEYKSLGTLASLGHFDGVGRVMMFRIKGFIAWWVWRSYYLSQMPRWERKVRLMIDWTVALFFHYDVVKLDLFGQPRQNSNESTVVAKQPGQSVRDREDVEPGGTGKLV